MELDQVSGRVAGRGGGAGLDRGVAAVAPFSFIWQRDALQRVRSFGLPSWHGGLTSRRGGGRGIRRAVVERAAESHYDCPPRHIPGLPALEHLLQQPLSNLRRGAAADRT